MNADLTRRSTIRELVAAFSKAEEDVRGAFATIIAAEKAVNVVFTLGGDGPIRVRAGRYDHRTDFDDIDGTIERMRRQAWGVIAERLELRRMMSIDRWRKLEEQIDKGDVPALSEENVAAFVHQHAASLPEMIGEAVAEVFEWLRPHNSVHKTNSELEVGERVVLTNVVERAWTGGGFGVNHYRQQHLIALENVFRALDGAGACTRGYLSDLENAIRETKNGAGETEYFAFRSFRNRNLHLRFKRLDLLTRLNQIAGGMRLRPARSA